MAEQSLRRSVRNNRPLHSLILLSFVLTLVILLCTACDLLKSTPPPDEGVLLKGNPDSLAADNIVDLPPVGVDQTQIENGVIMTRMDVRIAPDATVAQINHALQQVNAGIVSMAPGHLSMTVAVPRQASIEGLQSLADTLSRAAGIRYASIAREVAARDWPFPSGDTIDYNFAHYLVPARFPAAWNLQQRLAGCERKRVPVLIPDIFSPTPPGNFKTQLPGFPAIQGSGKDNHGYYVTSILASKWDAEEPTGANPFIQCLDLRPIDISGFSSAGSAVIITLAFPPDKFVLNTSFGFVSACYSITGEERPCFKEDFQKDIDFPYARANAALVWKEWTHDRWNDFVAVVSAGNQKDLWIYKMYPGMGEASYDSYISIVARDDMFFSFVKNSSSWNPPASSPELPSLVPDSGLIDQLQKTIKDKGMNRVPPAPNVLIVGSTTSIVNKFPEMNSVTESTFSNSEPDVLAVGEDIKPTCDPKGKKCRDGDFTGTSFSAPQVSGLVAYLWLLSDELREMPSPVTRELILENTRPSGKLIDAYAAVLSLDGTSALSPTATPNRFALLNVIKDNQVDAQDISEFLKNYYDGNGAPKEPNTPDFSRYDLNGDGYTGGNNKDRFDLDRNGSIQFGAATYSEAVTTIEGQEKRFNENEVTDLDILCYYMYSPLYSGDAQRRTALLKEACAGAAPAPEPSVVPPPGNISTTVPLPPSATETTQPAGAQLYNSVVQAFPPNEGLEATITITFTGANGTQTHTAVYPQAVPPGIEDVHEVSLIKCTTYQVTVTYQIQRGGYALAWSIGSIPVGPRDWVIGDPNFPGAKDSRGNIAWSPGTTDPNTQQTVPLSGTFTFPLSCNR